METVTQAQVAPGTHDLHEQPATSRCREKHSQLLLPTTTSQTVHILPSPILWGHFWPRTCLCTLIAQRVLKMRRGTCRPNFGDRDEPRDWGRKGEQGCRELVGQPEDTSNADRLQIHALLRPSMPAHSTCEGSHETTACAWVSLGMSHRCPCRDVVFLFPNRFSHQGREIISPSRTAGEAARGKGHRWGLGTFLPCPAGTSWHELKQGNPHTSGRGSQEPCAGKGSLQS